MSSEARADDPIKLDVGGGRDPLEGHLNVDIRPVDQVDVQAIATALPFEDGAVERIHANSLVPHVGDLNVAMEEFSRVLAPGGRLVLQATHANSTGIVADPDHRNWSWTSETPRWYDSGSPYEYYSDTDLELLDVHVRGWARPERFWLRPFSWLFKRTVHSVSNEVADELMKAPFAGGRVEAEWRKRS